MKEGRQCWTITLGRLTLEASVCDVLYGWEIAFQPSLCVGDADAPFGPHNHAMLSIALWRKAGSIALYW